MKAPVKVFADSLQVKVVAGFAVGLVFLIGLNWMVYQRQTRAREALERVSHTYVVFAELEEVRSLLSEAESAQRAFVITGDPRFSQATAPKLRAIPSNVARIREMTADNPQQQAAVAELERAIETRLATLAAVIALREDQGFEAARARIATLDGADQMRRVADILSRMREAEEHLLRAREHTNAASERNYLRALIVVDVAALALFAISFAAVWIELRRRRRTERERDQFFAMSLDMMCIADTNGYFRRINPAFDILGYTDGELLKRPFLDFVHPDDVDATRAEVAKLAAGEPTIHFENRYRCKDGSYRWLRWSTAPDDHGLLYATASDITDRKRFISELQDANASLDAILENIPAMLFLKDAEELRFVRLNRAGEDLLGWSRADLLGKSDHDFFPAEQAAFFIAKDRETLLHRQVVEMVEPIATRFRGERLLHTKKVAITGGDGRPRFLLGISEDITERRLAEKRVEQLTADLRRSNSELQDFAQIASHDLQEPLRKIRTFADRIKSKLAPDGAPEVRDYLDRMTSAAGRMQHLIDNLLSYSRVTSQARPSVPVDLNLVVKDALSELDEVVGRSQARVEIGALPTVPGDRSQLVQLFQNLLGNALKFRRPDVAPLVRVFCDGEQIVVQDNGIGFEPQYAERIFGIFERLHERRAYEGTGIGLSICRKIVERHRGTIVAIGDPGNGARIVITLPRGQPAGP